MRPQIELLKHHVDVATHFRNAFPTISIFGGATVRVITKQLPLDHYFALVIRFQKIHATQQRRFACFRRTNLRDNLATRNRIEPGTAKVDCRWPASGTPESRQKPQSTARADSTHVHDTIINSALAGDIKFFHG
ncbi:hypothetical protein FHW67_003699 [Herbaspirillum sp. Sphag1AN]|nr:MULTISPECIES: hypothetical protein [unclassified Herbaspirillum]MBB3214382.1 hypothetical protein [Herbaspirillum sp. Sphag1AN]MBB3247514.1 hypothetical protein [Herbaspirillum sp. Sphag64]